MAAIPPSPTAPSPAPGEGNRFHQDNVPAARRLRTEQTPTETILWECLRGRKCLNLKFRRQHPIGAFVLDFYCEERKVAIEIDGGYHLNLVQREHDAERQTLLEERGIRFIRIPADLVANDRAQVMRFLVESLIALP